MPATSKPTDQPTGRIITDEKSLETLFRAHFNALLAEGSDAGVDLPPWYDGSWGDGSGQPPELCADGEDNDCDGGVDEDGSVEVWSGLKIPQPAQDGGRGGVARPPRPAPSPHATQPLLATRRPLAPRPTPARPCPLR